MKEYPRSVVDRGVKRTVLRGFADARKPAVSVAIYIVAFHASALVCNNLLVAKSRIAPRYLSIHAWKLSLSFPNRLIVDIKRALSKTVGRNPLTYPEIKKYLIRK